MQYFSGSCHAYWKNTADLTPIAKIRKQFKDVLLVFILKQHQAEDAHILYPCILSLGRDKQKPW